MDYEFLKNEAYNNKISKQFNVVHIDKELVFMTEELGELGDALVRNDTAAIIDALGDITVYCLGLCGMFEWNANEVYEGSKADQTNNPLPHIVRELGMIAKTYKKSNKQQVKDIDKREEFKKYTGNLMHYCELVYKMLDEKQEKEFIQVVEEIIENNKKRVYQKKI
ncbi:hypothetical protein HY837_06325 [archaeon]|nr:hypothetical protein [archaeon]